MERLSRHDLNKNKRRVSQHPGKDAIRLDEGRTHGLGDLHGPDHTQNFMIISLLNFYLCFSFSSKKDCLQFTNVRTISLNKDVHLIKTGEIMREPSHILK